MSRLLNGTSGVYGLDEFLNKNTLKGFQIL